MQQNDPLAHQIWKLYSKQRRELPNSSRMENMTWRMMAMTLKRKPDAATTDAAAATTTRYDSRSRFRTYLRSV